MDEVGHSNSINSNYQTQQNRQVDCLDFFAFSCATVPTGVLAPWVGRYPIASVK